MAKPTSATIIYIEKAKLEMDNLFYRKNDFSHHNLKATQSCVQASV